MKHFYFKQLLLVLGLMVSIDASAAYVYDGIYYIFKPEGAVVYETPSNAPKYSGKVKIPETIQHNGNTYTVVRIEENAFANCVDLETVSIPNTVTWIGLYAFLNCTSLTTVTIRGHKGLTGIGVGAFQGCTSLKSFTVPNSVIKILDSAFQYCTGLEKITIGKSVTEIKGLVFDGCTSLSDIYCKAEVPPTLKKQSFNKTTRVIGKLHVPEGSIDKYKDSEFWQEFGTIEPLQPVDPNIHLLQTPNE